MFTVSSILAKHFTKEIHVETQPLFRGSPRWSSWLGARAWRGARAWARMVWSSHRALALVTAASGLLLVVSLGLGLLDGRQVGGAPVWMKPAKFGASVAAMAPVLAWIVGQMTGPRARRARRAGTVIAVVAAFELVVISVQAARGVPSHFNNATRIDAALFACMGAAITVLWLAQLAVAVWSFRQPFATPARTWAIRLGLVASLAGGAVGFAMSRPTSGQIASLHAGRPAPMLGAHAVGVPDGGPGLPVTRWSADGGDLRVPHFIGLHALQILPLAAWLVERRRRRSAGAPAVVALGASWIGLIVATLAQALRGRPLTSLDAAVEIALAAVLLSLAALTSRSAATRAPIARPARWPGSAPARIDLR